MAKLRCKSCGGEYTDVQADGTRYAHVCPPTTQATVERAGKSTTVDLAAVQPTDTIVVQRGTTTVKIAVSELQPGDVRIGDVTVERADKRDENPIGPSLVPGEPAPIKAEGQGVTPVTK